MLVNFRNAIDYVLTHTLKGMNSGLTADELANTIKLPDEFAKLPYLEEFYGTSHGLYVAFTMVILDGLTAIQQI